MKVLYPRSDLAASLQAFRVSGMIVLVVPSNEDDRHVRTHMLREPSDAALRPLHMDVARGDTNIRLRNFKRRGHIREGEVEIGEDPESHCFPPLTAMAL